MAGFGDNFDENDIDPAAEFIAREQNQLAGLEDEVQPALANLNIGANGSLTPPNFHNDFEFVSNAPGLIDPFNTDSGFNEPTVMTNEPVDSSLFSNNVIDTATPVLNGHTSNGHEEEEIFSQPTTPAKTPPIREEPEKIIKWRTAQKKRLEEKDAEEEKKKEEMRKAAKKELEEWYQHHAELIAKTKAANRNAEKQFVAETDDIEPGTEWERIAKLCDFNSKVGRTNKDVSRMRSIILQLKQSPLKKD